MQQLSLFEEPKPPEIPFPEFLAKRLNVKATRKGWKDPELIFMRTMDAIKPLEKRYIDTHAGDFCYEGDPPVVEDIEAFLFYGENLAMYEQILGGSDNVEELH
jgi:hypothetical protein